jgi:hypothetical protein
MSDEDLIGYLFDLLDPEERAAVAARVEAEPEVAARLDRLRVAAGPMLAVAEAEREEPPEPPPGLSVRAIGAVAHHLVEHEPRPTAGEAASESVIAAFLREYASDAPTDLEFGSGTRAKRSQAASEPRMPPPTDGPEYRSGGRIRADLLVAACIAFVGIGLVLSGIAKARHEYRMDRCRESLAKLHRGLAGYADSDPQGRYPQIGTKAHPTADTFATSLADLGFLEPGYKPGCPVAPEPLAYTYTLGFRGPNDALIGLRKPADNSCADEFDLMPIAADCPSGTAAPGVGPVSPHNHCMNVLFVGGNVRTTTSPNVGPRGDDIYRNVFGHVAAGANRNDAVLGRPGDKP